MDSLDASTLVSLGAGILSMVLGAYAIWLSLHFHHESSAALRRTQEVQGAIEKDISKLTLLFNHLYSDTFGMVKEIVTDTLASRRGLVEPWNAKAELQRKVEEELRELSLALNQRVASVLDAQRPLAPDAIPKISSDLSFLITDALQQSQEVQVRSAAEVARSQILSLLERHKRVLAASIFYDQLRNFDSEVLMQELEKLRREGRIAFDPDVLEPATVISITDAGNSSRE